MYLKELYIRNFRNFRNVKFIFNKGVNVLIGANGTGKTNAFQALRLLLDDDLPRNAIFLLESDFNRSLGNWKGHWIIISLHFNELKEDEPAQALFYHNSNSGPGQGSLSLYFRPNKTVRKELFELSRINDFERRKEEIIDRLNQITINDYEPVIVGKGTANFYDDNVYKTVVGDFQNYLFPNPEEEDKKIIGVQTNISFKNDFACTFAKALRDVVGEMKNSRYSPLLRLLNNVEIRNDDSIEISEMIRNLNSKIKNLPEINDISQGISNSLQKTAGFTYAPYIEINSNLSEDVRQALKSLSLQAGELNDKNYRGDLRELSLGGANLIYLALKIEEYKRIDHNKNKIMHFLLIEEPEAHLHPHVQKTLFQKYHDYDNNTQIILSTHSSHISSSCSLNQINVLYQEGNETVVSQPAEGIDSIEVKRLERYLDATRATLLFAKSIILVEGDAEMILIPLLVKKVFGVSLDEIGISLINIGGTQFQNIANVFGPNRLHRKCAIITDNDLSIVPLKQDTYDDEEFQKRCKRVEESGKSRKEKLDLYVQNNDFIKVFYADYTFEVEFLRAGNQQIITEVCKEIYSQDSYINDSINKIMDANLTVSGKEILRLAEKVGKGWLALMISDHVTKDTKIPEYILNALRFVSDLNELQKIEIIKYRLGNEKFEKLKKSTEDIYGNDYTIEELVKVYYQQHPEKLIF
ncbi:ATP-dependent endonuclease (plasmid) [Carboxydocella thermautotrophica]|nr:ATP-dependent endonuclease [Carboxydocella thermautotrophica]